MKCLVSDSIDRLRHDLVDDGCTPVVIDRLLKERGVETIREYTDQQIMTLIGSLSSSQILESLPDLAQTIIHFSHQNQHTSLQLIEDKLSDDLLSNPEQILVTDSIIKNLLRYRSLLQQVIDFSLLRNALLALYKEKIDVSNEYLVPLSLFVSLYFSELIRMFPSDQEWLDAMKHLIQIHYRSAPLYAYTPPADVLQHDDSLTFLEHGCIKLPNVVSSRRSDRHYDSCYKADGYHFDLISEYTGNNTFVFSNGILLGSLKYGTTERTRESTFMAMQTVATNPDEPTASRFPLILGGLYLIRDVEQFNAIKAAGKFCDIRGQDIAFMPLRAAQGLRSVKAEQYCRVIASVRKIITQEYYAAQSACAVDSTHAHR